MPDIETADPLALLPALLTELPPGVVGLLGGMVAVGLKGSQVGLSQQVGCVGAGGGGV